MAWRIATSLKVLLQEINQLAPNRSKASDGFIGDEAHQKVASDHNPNVEGVVTALDITHDPDNGLNAHVLANSLLASRHPNLKYIISAGRIAGAWTGWQWIDYKGANPHFRHIHVSVGRGEDGQSVQPYDDTRPWNVSKGEDMADKTALTKLWAAVTDTYPAPDSYLEYWDGKPLVGALDWVMEQDITSEVHRKARDYNRVVDTAEDRLRSINTLARQLGEAVKENPDAAAKLTQIKKLAQEIVNSTG